MTCADGVLTRPSYRVGMGPWRRHRSRVATGRAPLVERDRELRALSREAASAEAGARVALVTGEAGAGKSRLAAEFAATLPEAWRSLRTGAPYTERTVGAPFDHLVGRVAEQGDPTAALAQALAEALRREAAGRPLLATVEDLHWLDPTGLWALPRLLDLLADDPVLVLATFRLGSHRPGSDHSRAVAALARHPRSTEIRLAPLSVAGVAEMACGADPTAAAELHRRTGGNPFFVEALVQVGGQAGGDWTVTETVLERLVGLGDGDRRLIDLLAVAAAPIDAATIAALADSAGDDAPTCSAEMVERGVVAVLEGGALALRHGIVGEAVRGRLGPAERTGLHRRLAEAIEAGPEPERAADALAEHWSAAGETERAARWAVIAADRLLARRSYPTATALYRLALRCPEATHGVTRRGLYERAALAAAMAGDAETARRWAEAAGIAAPAVSVRDPVAGAWTNPAMADGDGAGEAPGPEDNRAGGPGGLPPAPLGPSATPASAAGGAASSGSARPGGGGTATAARIDAGTRRAMDIAAARRSLRRGDLRAAEALAAAALDEAVAAGDHGGSAAAALTVGYAGNLAAGDDALAAAGAAAVAAGDVVAAAGALAFRARLAWAMGHPDRAVALDEEALALCRRDSAEPRWVQLAAGAGMLRAARGELAAADQTAHQLIGSGDPIATGAAEVILAVGEIERGDAHAALARIEPLVPVVRSFGVDLFLVPVLVVAARAELARRDPERALVHLDEAEAVMWSPVHEQRADVLLLRGRAGWLAAAPAVTRAAASAADELAHDVTGPAVLAAADALGAMVDAIEGRADDAAARFEAAARGWERASRWLLAAEAWCDAAGQLVTRDPARAAADLDLAAAHATRRGYAVVAARCAAVRQALAQAGPDRQGVPAVLDALTPREVEVVLLAAAGRTNREIADEVYLSALTVRNYLSTAFAKLGVSRRSQLAALLAG